MKHLKFRIWDKQLKQMFYPGDNYTNTIVMQFDRDGDLSCIRIGESHADWDVTGALWDAETEYNTSNPMQCTGLTDKNGVDIYEGDIIATSFEDGVPKKEVFVYNEIAFRDGCFGYISELDRTTFCYLYDVDFTKEAVVGNRFTHPELIRPETDEEDVFDGEWYESRYTHITDVAPIIKGNLNNWLNYQEAIMQYQKADKFTDASIAASDWMAMRKECFDEGMTAKETFYSFYYEKNLRR